MLFYTIYIYFKNIKFSVYVKTGILFIHFIFLNIFLFLFLISWNKYFLQKM